MNNISRQIANLDICPLRYMTWKVQEWSILGIDGPLERKMVHPYQGIREGCVCVCVHIYSLYYFSFLKHKNPQRTTFWNTKMLKQVPGTAHYYNLTPCFRYDPINVCKAAINLVSNSGLHAVLPKCRGNGWEESSYPVRKGSSIKGLWGQVITAPWRRVRAALGRPSWWVTCLNPFWSPPTMDALSKATFDLVRGIRSMELKS